MLLTEDAACSNTKQKWVPLNLAVAGNNKRKAQQRLREILVEAEKNQSVITSNVLFIDWMLAWLDQKQASISKGTYEGYKLYLDKHIIPYFRPQKLTLSKLNAQHLQGYFNAKIKEGQSACTLHKHNAILNGSLKEAVLKDIIPFNPADKVTLPKKKNTTALPTPWKKQKLCSTALMTIPSDLQSFWASSMVCAEVR